MDEWGKKMDERRLSELLLSADQVAQPGVKMRVTGQDVSQKGGFWFAMKPGDDPSCFAYQHDTRCYIPGVDGSLVISIESATGGVGQIDGC